MQLFESVQEIHPPASPGSKPKQTTYDPLRVARETAEEVSSIAHHSSKGSPVSRSQSRFPSHGSQLAELDCSANGKHFTLSQLPEGALQDEELDHVGRSFELGRTLTPSRRADSVASCASEWVTRPEGVLLADGPLAHVAPSSLSRVRHPRKPSVESGSAGSGHSCE